MSSKIISWPDKYRGHSAEKLIDSCPNCDGPTRVQRHDQRLIWPVLTENTAPPLTQYVREEVWRCLVCQKSMTEIHVYEESDSQSRSPAYSKLIYPDRPPRSLPSEAPRTVASLFREASICEFAGAVRGAAGLYRSAVEAIAEDRAVSDGTLEAKIEKLRELGVESDVVRFLHEARILGNWSLHDGIEFSEEEVDGVAHLIEDAIEQIYVTPSRREAMQRARADRRASIRTSGSTQSDVPRS